MQEEERVYSVENDLEKYKYNYYAADYIRTVCGSTYS